MYPREKNYFKKAVVRIFKLTLLSVFLVLFVFGIYMFTGKTKPAKEMEFGLTFSQKFAEEMKLDWKEVFLAALDDLGVRRFRLVAYWNKIEPVPGQYSFEDLDWQISEVGRRGGQVILAIGERVPRWPECHAPLWVKELDKEEKEERLKQLLTTIVERYRDNPAIWAWQIENEPFLWHFGECPPLDRDFFKKEIALVRELDFAKGRPIVLTTSGELSLWSQAAMEADILGTSLYRIVWLRKLGIHFRYPIPPVFYYKRAELTKWLTGVKDVIVIELQGEPWGKKMIYETTVREQEKSMDLEKFREIVDYTYRVGAFSQAYLWGVEWWYQRKEDGNDSMWEEAKRLWH